MIRYEECDESLVEVFLNVLDERFPAYQHMKFKLLFDLKKRAKQGRITLATIETVGPKLKFFSKDNVAVDGYDYIIIVDKKAWQLSNEKDRKRLISHELRHVFIDEKGNYKLTGHEIEDFYMEIKLNEDDPEWCKKLASLVCSIYDQEKALQKEKGNNYV